MKHRRSPEPTAAKVHPPLLTLQLHGTARVVAAAGVAGVAQVVLERRAAALCALAALEPGFPRERAAAWLWPDSSDARRNLRQQLLRFKQQFGLALLAGGEGLQLAAGVQLANPGRSAAPWLAELDFDDSETFSGWLQTQRQRRRAHLRDMLLGELAQAKAAHDLEAAVHAAQALCDAEPEHEEHPRALMRVHGGVRLLPQEMLG